MNILPLYQQRRAGQRGGLFLGLIIGLLIGLAAALAVAIYVTKVPVPLINKGLAAKNPAEQDAQEAQKNKNWDPNSPLYGKTPAKSQPAATTATASDIPATPSAAVSSAPTVAKPSTSASAPKAVATAQPAATASAAKPSADPLGDLAKSKTAVSTQASANAGADPFSYFIQAGAFRTAEDAEAQRAKVVMAGFEAKITEREQSGRTVFRVRVGPIDNKDAADRAKEKLEAAGFESAIVRVQR
jgi:cell division protein FtsN